MMQYLTPKKASIRSNSSSSLKRKIKKYLCRHLKNSIPRPFSRYDILCNMHSPTTVESGMTFIFYSLVSRMSSHFVKVKKKRTISILHVVLIHQIHIF